MSEKGNQAVKTVSFMMLITLFGKILGMVREQLLAANYGTDMQAAAFCIGNFCKLYPCFCGIFAEKGAAGGVFACEPLYYDDFDRYAFDDASGDGVCEAADASDCARL